MSAFVLCLCVLCYFVANIYQNKFSSTLEGRMFPMNCFQMAWMGMAVVAFTIFELVTDGLQFSGTTIVYGIAAGIFTLLGSMCLLGALAVGPLSLTILIFSMYVVVPPVFAMLFLGERFTVCQIIGIVLIVLVIILSNYNKDESGKKYSRKWWLMCIGCAVFTGTSNYIAKVHQTKLPGREVREYAIVSYVLAILLAFCFALYFRVKEAKEERKSYQFRVVYFLIPAVMVALTQGGANLCNLYNASRLPTIILYPVTQLATLMLTMVYGLIFLKERISRVTVACLVMGAAAIVLMNF